jgi:hypothetical protein
MMTNHLPTDRLPDAPCLLPTEATVGHGYIAETGENAITLTLLHDGTRPFNVVFPPDLAMVVAAGLAQACVRLRKLSTGNPEEGNENHHDETEEDNAQ